LDDSINASFFSQKREGSPLTRVEFFPLIFFPFYSVDFLRRKRPPLRKKSFLNAERILPKVKPLLPKGYFLFSISPPADKVPPSG